MFVENDSTSSPEGLYIFLSFQIPQLQFLSHQQRRLLLIHSFMIMKMYNCLLKQIHIFYFSTYKTSTLYILLQNYVFLQHFAQQGEKIPNQIAKKQLYS